MNRTQSTALVFAIFIFVASVGSIFFSIGFGYPTQATEVKSEEFYDTSFWDLSDAISLPLNVQLISTEVSSVQTGIGSVQLNITQFTFLSETYESVNVRINSYLMQRVDLLTDAPAILLLHGYGSNVLELLPMMHEIAATGYIVMGIDSPGSGDSTNFPQLNPYTFYDVSDGPTSAHIYHSVWSAARALTYLESRTLASSIIVGGASMGGMETVILSAIDDRVDGSLSMISGGNLFESLMEGSLINSLINPDYDIGSEELDLLQRWFDPIAYYRQLTKPLFMIFGTNDPFFPVSGFMQTIDEISAPLTLSIRPNYGHVVDTSWSEVIVRWMNAEFRATPSYPIILNVTSTELLTVAGLTLQVRVASTSLSDFYICWRTGNPGATWTITPMTLVDDEYVVDLTPLLVGKVTYFVYSAEESTVLMSSELLIGNSGSFGLFVLAILSAIAIFFLSQMTGWKITQSNLIRQLPIGVGIVMIGLGMILPFYGIEGRVEISLLSFIEVHGQALGLSGWFLTLALFILYYIVALAAVRHQLEFRVVVAVWFPMLVLVTIAHIFFAGVFAISGGLNYVYTGFGAFLMIFAVPVMLIMESFFKDTTAEEKLIAKVLENQTV